MEWAREHLVQLRQGAVDRVDVDAVVTEVVSTDVFAQIVDVAGWGGVLTCGMVWRSGKELVVRIQCVLKQHAGRDRGSMRRNAGPIAF